MAPKVEPKKGQTSLFSFFRKPATPVEIPVSVPIVEVIIDESSCALLAQESKRSLVTEANNSDNEDIKIKSKRQKKIVIGDEDEEWNETEPLSNPTEESDDEEEFVDSDDESSAGKGKRKFRPRQDASRLSSRKPPLPSISTSSSVRKTPLSLSTPQTGSHIFDRLANTPTSAPSPTMSSQRTPSPTCEAFFGGGSAQKSSQQPSPSLPAEGGAVCGQGSHEHNSYEFLKPGIRRDKHGRKSDHPEYNPRSLFLPEKYMREQSPAMTQWWKFKCDNMDTVLFFKVGKFYELFHMDADIAMTELDLIYMRGSKAHSGFPEISYGKMASALVTRGYRVARIEQTETPDMLKERNDSSGRGAKKEKVVAREMCSVLSKGTRTYCHLDDMSLLEDSSGTGSDSLLLCIKEQVDSVSAVPEYGVCCVDTITGAVTLGQFQDDNQRSRLRTLVARYRPTEVLLEHGAHSQDVIGLIRLMFPTCAIEYLRGEEMPAASEAVQLISDGDYFQQSLSESSQMTMTPDNDNIDLKRQHWPVLLQAAVNGLVDGSSELVMQATGGALWQLQRSLIDYEILSLGKFFAYVPSDDEIYHLEGAAAAGGDEVAAASKTFSQLAQLSVPTSDFCTAEKSSEATSGDNGLTTMTLDAVALANLEILVNNFDRTEKGSLWAFINRCKTQFGRRLLHDWLCHPLYRACDIKKRADAVEELLTVVSYASVEGSQGRDPACCTDTASECRRLLKTVPDLERLLLRVHSTGLKSKGRDHPDSRAILFEMNVHTARKIRDFADILNGFDTVARVISLYENLSLESWLLRRIVKCTSAGGKVPLQAMKKLLAHFKEIFDEKQAKKEGSIKPRAGVDKEYDSAKQSISTIEAYFEQYLRDMKKKTGINDLNYYGSRNDRFQIEVPITQTSKVPDDWTSKSQKKSHRRYWTPVIESKLKELVIAEERMADAQKDTLRRIFEKFDSSRDVWSDAVSCVSVLDGLLALADVSSSPGYTWPEIVEGETPMLHIDSGRHPMLEFAMSQRGDGEYIPNSLSLGGKLPGNNGNSNSNSSVQYLPRLLLLSGPNMGGKSTLLRQTCLIAIMSQLGMKVPASRCRMTPLDRIFTRVGACDRILAGQSTFFVELAETAIILKSATKHSLCILDELGRGTATFDGTAIAHAVTDYLVQKSRPLCLFATHYHSLVADWQIDARVSLSHMDCIVQEAQEEGDYDGEITFLYRLCDGASPKSYGVNVARLARLPDEVIRLASLQSKEFEATMALQSAKNNDNHRMIVVTAYFDRLVSIAHSCGDMTSEEFVYLANEMWNRFHSDSKLKK